MRIAINAISAKRGGAVTYIQNVLPELLCQMDAAHELVVWRPEAETGDAQWPAGIEYSSDSSSHGQSKASANPLSRLWFDQAQLPGRLKADGIDLLFSAANFGVLRCPSRQVLLVQNTLAFDETFLQRMPAKVRAYYIFQRYLILHSIKASEAVLFPSQAIHDLVRRYAKGNPKKWPQNWLVAPFGTRHDLFYPSDRSTRDQSQPVRLLHISLYCDQKNLGTLLQATQTLHAQEPHRYNLRVTAGFAQDWLGQSAMFPNFRREQALFRELEAKGIAEDTNWLKYSTLPELYRSSDIFIFPSYTESFGFPLVEAMACGLPIVASDVPVNREMCGDAAIYFSTFDADDCAQAIRTVASDESLRLKLSALSLERAKRFSWKHHVAQLLRAFTQ